jgi:hypothetical protein
MCIWTAFGHLNEYTLTDDIGYLDEGFYVASMAVTEMFSCILMGLKRNVMAEKFD